MAIGNDFQLDVVANAQALDKSIKAVTTTKTYKIKIEADGTQTKTLAQSTEKLANAQGQLLNVTTKYNKEGQATSAVVKDISKNVKGLGADFLETTGKVFKFGLSTAVISVFVTSITEAVTTVKDFDDALTRYQKVSDLSGQSLETFSENLGKMGADVARTRTQMIEAATAWKQSGYSDEDSAKLAKISEMFRNISDAEISSQESAGFIISQMKAYGNETETFAQHTIDAINNVSNNMSVSSSDVSEGLSKSAAGMSALGNSFEETTALVSAGTEIMHNQASKVSRGLVSVGNNIAKLAKESKTFNIETKDGEKSIELINSQTGDLNSTYEVLSQISEQWGNMTEQQKTNLGITLAGKNQFSVFQSVLGNFADAQKGLTLALNSQGSAEEENAKYVKSLEGRITSLKANFQELVLGKGGLKDFATILVSVANGTLKVINTLGGLPTLLLTITTLIVSFKGASIVTGISNIITSIGGLKGVLTSLVDIIPNAISMWDAYSVQQGIAAEEIQLAGGEIVTANELMQASIPVIGLVLAGITALVAGVSAYSSAQEEARSKAISTLDSFSQTNDELKTSVSQVNDATTSRSQLISIMKQLDGSYDSEKDKLKDINELRQEAIEKIYEQSKAQAKETLISTGSQYTKSKNYLSEKGVSVAEGSVGLKPRQQLKLLNKELAKYQKLIEKDKKLLPTEQMAYDSLTKSRNKLNDKIKDAEEVISKYEDAQKIANMSIKDYINYQKDAESETGSAESTQDDLNKALETSSGAYADASSSVINLENDYSTLSDAVSEYNSSNGKSVDAISQILSLDSKYLSILEIKNGKLMINKQSALDMANAEIDQAEAALYQKTADELAAGSFDDYSSSADKAQASSSNFQTPLAGVSAALASVTKNAYAAGGAVSYYEAKLRNSDSYKSAGSEAKKKALSELKKEIKLYEILRGNLGKSVSATNSATSATSKNTGATKKNTGANNSNAKSIDNQNEKLEEQKQKLEDLIDKYKDLFDYMKDVVEKENDKLEKQRDKAIKDVDKYYNKKIKADKLIAANAKVEKEFELNSIQAEIDSKQSKLDESEEYYDSLSEAADDYYNGLLDNIEKEQEATDKENEAIEESIKLKELQEELERAKSTKVKVYGESGFEYRKDESAVSTANKNLEDYNRELAQKRQEEAYEDAKTAIQAQADAKQKEIEAEQQNNKEKLESEIAQLELEKNIKEQYYNDEIASAHSRVVKLEEEKKAEEASVTKHFNKIISKNNKYLSLLEKGENRYELLKNKHNYNVLSSADIEEQSYSQRLASLSKFVSEYLALQAKLNSSSLSSSSSSSSSKSSAKHASGVASVDSNEIAFVGDSPNNNELLIGSKLNGVPMSLEKGSGVVNAKSTNTLAGILNSIGSIMPNSSNVRPLNTNTQNVSDSVTIQQVILPNVSDANSFVEELKSFKSRMIQKSYTTT